MPKTLPNNCNISEWLTFEFLIELLILTLSWLQTVDCAYPSDWCPLCCRLIYLLAQTDLSLLPTSGQPPSHSSMPSLSLHICVYEWARIIAHPLSSLMGLISINITVERTFVLPQPAFLTNPFSWQWVPGGLHNFLTGFVFFQGGGATNVLSSVWVMHGCGCLKASNILFRKGAEIWLQNGRKDTSGDEKTRVKEPGRENNDLEEDRETYESRKCKSWL